MMLNRRSILNEKFSIEGKLKLRNNWREKFEDAKNIWNLGVGGIFSENSEDGLTIKYPLSLEVGPDAFEYMSKYPDGGDIMDIFNETSQVEIDVFDNGYFRSNILSNRKKMLSFYLFSCWSVLLGFADDIELYNIEWDETIIPPYLPFIGCALDVVEAILPFMNYTDETLKNTLQIMEVDTLSLYDPNIELFSPFYGMLQVRLSELPFDKESLEASGVNTSDDNLLKDILNYWVFSNEGLDAFDSVFDVSSFDLSRLTRWSSLFSGVPTKHIAFSPKLNTSHVKMMDKLFTECTDLEELTLNFQTENVFTMKSMFGKCSSLVSLDITSFNTSNVIDFSYMFNNCGRLTSLDLSNFDTSEVTDMSCMFGNCSGLTSLDLSNFDTSNVTNMYGMFSGCTNLQMLDLSNFRAINISTIIGIFRVCNNLTYIKTNRAFRDLCLEDINKTQLPVVFRDINYEGWEIID